MAPKTGKKKIVKKVFKRRVPRPVFKNNSNVGVGFPKKMTMTHKYHENSDITSTLGVAQYQRFQCNGMFKPNFTSAGHQPYYYDQMSALYNHYTVIGSKITVRIIPKTATTVAFFVTLSQNDDTTQTAGIDATVEGGGGKCVVLPANSNGTIKTMVNKWSAKKTFGGSVLANDNLQGSVGANPAEATTWSIGLVACDGTSTVSCTFDVIIQYIAVWKEIKDIAAS